MAGPRIGRRAQTTICTGPFKVPEWIPGDHVTLVRHDAYWKPNLPYLERVVLKPVNNPEAMVAALETGTIDAAVGVAYDQVQRLRGQPRLRLAPDDTRAFLNIFYRVHAFMSRKCSAEV